MITKTFDQIEAADIQALIRDQTSEGKTLEYKQELPGRTDKAKKEFLTDIISFANAAGGDIIYGIEEQRDANGKTTGIPKDAPGLEGINADEEIRRLENMIRDSIEPRIPGIHIKSIPGFPKGPILIIRIPQSWVAPHLLRTGQGSYRIFTRSSAGKRPLDVTELRSMFVASVSLRQRIQNIRDDRLAKILAGETPVAMSEGGKVVLHVISVQKLMSDEQIDPRMVRELLEINGLRLIGNRSGYPSTGRLNLDGFVGYWTGGEPRVLSYTQIFRDGYIEAVNMDLVDSPLAKNIISISLLERGIIYQGFEYLNIFKQLGVDPPFVIFISLLNVKGFSFSQGPVSDNHVIDRDHVLLPELLLEKYPETPEEWARILQSTFDILWQAVGFERSMSYDERGNWRPR